MKLRHLLIAGILLLLLSPHARATQADDTTITIDGETAGPTSLIVQLTLSASNTSVLAGIQFTIAPKPGSVTRPFSQTFSASYLAKQGYLVSSSGEIFLPIYGLYASYTNSVTLRYLFLDGSSQLADTTVTTDSFSDLCGISTPTVLQARTSNTALSYDFMLVRGACGGASGISPVILDTDGQVRWISPFASESVLTAASGFFDNAVYLTQGSMLYRVDLDGTITPVGDYASLGVINFHHQIDPGKTGMILEADTTSYVETENIEVDGAGNVIKTWNLADIISAAMLAGGDDPGEFVYPTPTDWFHNNSVTYRRSDNSLIVSSREDFVIALGYESDEISWILGDTTKKWYQFPSLQTFALALGPDTLPPIGQHSVGITQDDKLLLMDNGRNSQFQTPLGINRDYSSPRKYELDLTERVATEVWNYERDQSIYSQFCGSTYEDAPLNYLIDYALITTEGTIETTAQIAGLSASGDLVFDYQYPTGGCNTAYNSLPLHAEEFSLSTAAQALNISTRGKVDLGENALVGGFIITGSDSKVVILRALGPSLADVGVSGTLANPVFTLYDSTGALVASNDDWANAAAANEIQAQGLAPLNAAESASVQELAPGSYTFVVSGKDNTGGIALVEAYDLTRNSNSNLGNLSTRGFIGSGDDVLISGFIIGTRNSANIVLRAIGPSLSSLGVSDALSDPKLTVYDSNGAAVGSNDNWQQDANASVLQLNGLAPTDPAEAATLLNLSPGAYTAVVQVAQGGTGVGLVEVYNLP